MKDIFIISNQHGQFLGKQGQWLDESEPTAVWRSPHRDVALNYLIESNSRDIEQRMVLLQCPLNEKDIPLLGDAEPARKSAPVTFDEPEANARTDAENGEEETDADNDNADEANIEEDSIEEDSIEEDSIEENGVELPDDDMDVARD